MGNEGRLKGIAAVVMGGLVFGACKGNDQSAPNYSQRYRLVADLRLVAEVVEAVSRKEGKVVYVDQSNILVLARELPYSRQSLDHLERAVAGGLLFETDRAYVGVPVSRLSKSDLIVKLRFPDSTVVD